MGKIEDNIRSMSDEQLLKIVQKDYEDYTEEAVNWAADELNKRKININIKRKEEEIEDKNAVEKKNYGEGYITAVRVFAWTELAACILITIFLIVNNIDDGIYHISQVTAMFYYLFNGVFIFVLLMIISYIAENLIHIRKNTEK